MNKFIKFFPILCFSLAVISCGSDSDDNDSPVNPTPTPTNTNVNSNFAEANQVTHRIEFPKVKGGSSLIVTHYDNNEVNYTVEWDSVKRSCRWSCYELYASNLQHNTTRWRVDGNDRYSKQYPTDPDLHCSTAWQAGRNTDPFWGSGYDHGHLCPSGDRLNSANANYQTFYLSNMMPQLNGFNAGVWEKMESWVRKQVDTSTKDTLFVVKGGTIDKSSQVNPATVHGLTIPTYYYMAVLKHAANGEYKAMAFWVKHEANNTSLISQYAISVDELENLTGIDFFCNLPDDLENKVEGVSSSEVKNAWSWDF